MIARVASHFVSRQFVQFLMAGGVAALAQWVSRFIFTQWMSYQLAVLAAFGVGLTFGYILNALFVFPQSTRSRWAQVGYFTLFNVLALPVIWGVSVFLGAILLPHVMPRLLAEAVGNGVGILTPVAINFLLHKTFTFRAEARDQEREPT